MGSIRSSCNFTSNNQNLLKNETILKKDYSDLNYKHFNFVELQMLYEAIKENIKVVNDLFKHESRY